MPLDCTLILGTCCLLLWFTQDAEYIVAKAIHDGVIDAVIDRKGRFLHSKVSIRFIRVARVGASLLLSALRRRTSMCTRRLSRSRRSTAE